MGAALTHLAMFSLENNGYDVQHSYSYEAPRVGNGAFSAEFTRRFGRSFPVFRVTHYKDPVVHLPFEWMGYKHVETEVYIDERGAYKVCKGTEDPTCSNQWLIDPLAVGYHCASPLLPHGSICNGCDAAARATAEASLLV